MTDVPALSDEQICGHEAGHAVVAHLMADEIREVVTYTGEQSAAIRPVDWPPSRATLLAGVAAEFLLGFEVVPVRAARDMGYAAALPVDPDEPLPLTLLSVRREVLEALAAWFLDVRTVRGVISGAEVHRYLADRDCVYGCRGEPSP